ncbi:EAL domain-containing protein [Pseudoalteromonas sp. SWN29]|uniref:EAL domain-containing protein n=1 Tax=Pseudoalteromonas sp. SWN29 TaxID=2792064 RepID=UPI0018CD7930|nr:EAL domain-containing protein [Pseudoalteromonas sp. SWN29]MBH0025469.1 EAL domain-containing protein [Pseudoalteromonas sp. SWN29]
MQKTKHWLLKNFKGISFVLFLMMVISFNFILNDALHQKVHVSGQQFVKQVFELNLSPSINNDVLIALAKSEGFMLEVQKSVEHFRFLVNLEREVFTYKTLSLSLYHYPAWVTQSYLFILLNLIILGAVNWSYRWWRLLKVNHKVAFKNQVIQPTKTTQQKQKKTQLIKQVKSCELSSLYGANAVSHSLFLLIECDCSFDKKTDKEASFKVLITKKLTELKGASVKELNSSYLAVTLPNIPINELDSYIEKLHKNLFLICQNHQKNITHKDIKIGACDYQIGADQVTVYQLAKSALVLSQSNLLQHCHRLALNHCQEKLLSSKQVIENIKKNKFILFFQPLFELSSGEILQHEALIRVRHSQLGLLAARYFIKQVYSNQDALILDKAVITQVKKLMLSEPSALTVSINLHPKNWFNNAFWEWVTNQIAELKLNAKLQFEISEIEFFTHRELLTNALNIIKKGHSHIIIDNIKSSEKVAMLVGYSQVCGLKLSYELVHLLNENTQNQKKIKKIVEAANLLNLPVYAVGVETQKELFTLDKLGVVGAQGFYFSEPLQEFTQAVFN